MVQVQIILVNGFDELDAIIPFEVFQSAAAIGADVQAELVALDESMVITAAHGLRVQPEAKLAIDRQPNILIVPGGGWIDRAPQGARAEVERGTIPAAISRLHQKGTTIASVCTGAMLVAAAGLLSGRPAITHHGAIEDLKATGAEIVKARVIDEGDIITAGGITSGLELALWLLERYFAPETAHKIETMLEYERRGTVWRRSAY
jgi:transcriptional regulator GlxA family with amidase domain